jgi:Fe-S cluster assembly ATP-binding protein
VTIDVREVDVAEVNTNPLLQVENLSLRRGGRDILFQVNLTVRAGEVHGLLGLNGSGKSSLAYALMGCADYLPEEGRIWFADLEITRLSISERAQLGLTLAWQEPARFEGLTVRAFLSLGLKTPDQESVRAALEAVALAPASYLGRRVDQALSGGERKRIELASILTMSPRLAILDEPDSGIDMLTLSDVESLIRRMPAHGTTVLLITHRDEMLRIADSASLMCQGSIVFHGTPMEVREFYGSRCRVHSQTLGRQTWENVPIEAGVA